MDAWMLPVPRDSLPAKMFSYVLPKVAQPRMNIRQEQRSVLDVARGELVEKELDVMIQRRARKGDVDPDEREEL